MGIKKKFGIHIPPPKEKEPGNPVTLEFVIGGIIPSKKNMQIPSFNYKWVYEQVKMQGRKQPSFTSKQFRDTVWMLIKSIKLFITNPTKYQKWEESTKNTIVNQAAQWRQSYADVGLSFPITRCSIRIRHCWKDSYPRDNSNKAEGIHDILVSTGIIADDSYTCLFKNSSDAACYKGEITDHVTIIYLTAYKW
jgi:hypothetical protein